MDMKMLTYSNYITYIERNRFMSHFGKKVLYLMKKLVKQENLSPSI